MNEELGLFKSLNEKYIKRLREDLDFHKQKAAENEAVLKAIDEKDPDLMDLVKMCEDSNDLIHYAVSNLTKYKKLKHIPLTLDCGQLIPIPLDEFYKRRREAIMKYAAELNGDEYPMPQPKDIWGPRGVDDFQRRDFNLMAAKNKIVKKMRPEEIELIRTFRKQGWFLRDVVLKIITRGQCLFEAYPISDNAFVFFGLCDGWTIQIKGKDFQPSEYHILEMICEYELYHLDVKVVTFKALEYGTNFDFTIHKEDEIQKIYIENTT